MTTTLTPQPAHAPAAAATTRESFRHLLEAQRADCLRQRELAVAEGVTAMPDPVAVRRAAGLLLTLGEIDAALGRVADGTYRVCVTCGADIPTERLMARPFAAGCVDCPVPAR